MAQPSMMLSSTITPLADADSGADAAGLAGTGRPADPSAPSRGAVVLAAVSIFAVAFAARLLPMVGGGGLLGLGNYDDGVNYAAAAAFVEGLWPYRDFLLLHPPGVIVALAPFAAVGSVFGDPTGMLVGRLAWMALGGVNALLVARVLLPVSARAALLGAAVYAVFFPAIYADHTVLLEPPAACCLLISLILLRSTTHPASTSVLRLVAAGAILGSAASIKIWGVVPVLLIAVWLFFVHSRRGALAYLGAAAGACAAICLPFFVAAPAPMWQMVVLAQTGRDRSNATIAKRLIDIAGVQLWAGTRLTWVVAVALLLTAGCVIVALISRPTRLLAMVWLVSFGLLMATPPWWLHYSGLMAAPTALIGGAASDRIIVGVQRVTGGRRWVGVSLTVAALLSLGAYTSRLPGESMSRAFPGQELGRVLADRQGCIATDDPSTLIFMDLLRRNLERGCRVEIDLGGYNHYSYSLRPEVARTYRAKNPQFQRYMMEYFRSSDTVITVKFRRGSDFSPESARSYYRWPELHRIGNRIVRIPQP